jgi:hypothetical protein
MSRDISRLRILAFAALVAGWACNDSSPTSPGKQDEGLVGPSAALGTAGYPGNPQPGQITVCKATGSPAGTYHFSVSASGSIAGDQMTSAVTLSPGQCTVVFERTTGGTALVSVTVAEVIPSGATFHLDHVDARDYNGTRTVSGPSVTLDINQYHAGLANFFNIANPPGPGTGHVILCKSQSSPVGLFTFHVTAVGTIASDVIKQNVSLRAGSCDTVFVRVTAGPIAAAVTITESVAANASVFLQNVLVDGKATATVGAGVVVTQNLTPDRVVVFVNASATVGASVAYLPSTGTPGIVHLCKSSDSPPGTFNFKVTALGTVATDQVVSTVSLTAGTCKVIFIRTVPQLVGATLAITEDIGLLANFRVAKIAKITAGGLANITGAVGLVVTENALPGGGTVVVFFNQRISLLP